MLSFVNSVLQKFEFIHNDNVRVAVMTYDSTAVKYLINLTDTDLSNTSTIRSYLTSAEKSRSPLDFNLPTAAASNLTRALERLPGSDVIRKEAWRVAVILTDNLHTSDIAPTFRQVLQVNTQVLDHLANIF